MTAAKSISGKAKTKTAEKLKLHEFLEHQIAICGKSQKEIAFEIGYTKPNIITMFKQGITKVPIEKIAPLAEAIGVDKVRLLRMAMNEYMPATLEAIESVMNALVTQNEANIIAELRKHTHEDDPRMSTADSRKALAAFAKTLTYI